MKNPFKPTAGARPPILIGRPTALDSFKEGLRDGSGAPGLLTFVTGARGVGKTVLLSEAEGAARACGWTVISDTGTVGLLARIGEAARLQLHDLGAADPDGSQYSLGGMSFNAGSALPPGQQVALRYVFEELLEGLAAQDAGVLISVDEIQAANRAEVTDLAALVQHLIRADLPIGLIAGGVPSAVDELLSAGAATFMRRAERITLEPMPFGEVRDALAATFEGTGVPVSPEDLERMAAATGGFPYLVQLVGYYVWRLAFAAGGASDEIVAEGLNAARGRLGATVIASAFTGLSGTDKTFLVKMAEDEGPSRFKDIAARMGGTPQFAGVYRRRLLNAGVVESRGFGLLDFAVPYLRGFLREHAALDADLGSAGRG